MKLSGIVLLHCICLSSFSQTAPAISWYKMLTGKIDRYPVTLHLHKAGHQYNGYYYYDAQQQPVSFSGEDSSLNGKIKLVSYTPPDNNEEFVFSLSGSSAAGNWKKNEKAQPVPFTATETKAPLAFTYVFTNGSVLLRPKLKDSPAASYEGASVWPLGNTSTHVFLKKIIRQLFDEKNNSTDEIGALFLKWKKKFFAGYTNEHKSVTEKKIKEASPVYASALSNKLMIAYLSDKILTLSFFTYDYSGGAHGNYGTTYTAIDLTANKKLKLADIINAQGQKALSGLLERYFRQANHLQPADSLQKAGLFENNIKPNDNFYVTAKGVGFNYTPYEIGPYVMGEISIFIPIAELQDYLQPSFKSLLY